MLRNGRAAKPTGINMKRLQAALQGSWSPRTSSLWTIKNPARGQCSVTACVVYALYSGDIMKTLTPDGWHFYNSINGLRFDFTASQFVRPIEYRDRLSSFEEALSDTTVEQYNILLAAVASLLMDPI